MARFTFVVLHYLAEDLTITCVENILARFATPDQGKHSVHVVVVDNGSPNGSGDRLAMRWKDASDVTVLLSPKNEGFARGNNLGYRWACEHVVPDFVVVMNNDVEIDRDDFLDHVVAEYEREPYGILGPDIYCPASGSHQSPSHASWPDLSRVEEMIARYDAANESFARHYVATKLEPVRKGITRRLHRVKCLARGACKRVLRLVRALWQKARLSSNDSATAAVARDATTTHGPVSGSGTSASEASRHEAWRVPATGVVLHGACYVFSRDFIERRENAFNPNTFLYLEEDILAFECSRDGIPMRYDPTIGVIHHEDGATKAAFRTAYAREKLKSREKARSLLVLRDLLRESS